VLEELFRVLGAGGQLFILTYLYNDGSEWSALARDIAWESRTGMSLHVYSAAGYTAMLKTGGWTDILMEEWVADSNDQYGPVHADHSRALLITARTPSG
jgi:hypothetical protein